MRDAAGALRSKSGAITVEELRMYFCARIPGLLDATAKSLGCGAAELIALARAGELRFEDMVVPEELLQELEDGQTRPDDGS